MASVSDDSDSDDSYVTAVSTTKPEKHSNHAKFFERFTSNFQTQSEVLHQPSSEIPTNLKHDLPSPNYISNLLRKSTPNGAAHQRPSLSPKTRNGPEANCVRRSPGTDSSNYVQVDSRRQRLLRCLTTSEEKPERFERPRQRFSWIHVRGKFTPPVSKLPIDNCINGTLIAMKWNILRPIQTYSYPAIRENFSTVMIGRKTAGKTLGFIGPLMDRLLSKTKPNKAGYGPLVIILCTTSQVITNIGNICKKFLPRESPIKILCATGGCGEKYDIKTQQRVLEGTDVLVTSPLWLIRNLRGSWLVNFDRLESVVLENTDLLLETPFDVSIRSLMGIVLRLKDQEIQWIMTGRTWTPTLRGVVGHLGENVTILFDDMLEAAMSNHISVQFSMHNEQAKIQHLIEYLEEKAGQGGRIAVVCRSEVEVIDVSQYLRARGQQPISVSGVFMNVAPEVNKAWRAEKNALLVCSDVQLDMVSIDDAVLIVHYSLPTDLYSAFTERFSLFVANFSPYLPVSSDASADNPDVKARQTELSTVIYVDEHTQIQMPKIFRRFPIKDNSNITQYIRDIETQREKEKPWFSLCFYLMSRGKCPYRHQCKFRHVPMTDRDQPDPRHRGVVVFTPISVIDGATFSARIIRTTDASGNRHEFSNLISQIQEELQEYFRNSEDRAGVGSYKLGHIYASRLKLPTEHEPHFYRTQLLRKIDKDKNNVVYFVRLIDFGIRLEAKENEMWELPDELSALPEQAVVMHLLGVVPFDYDTSWTVPAVNWMREQVIQTSLTDDQYWQATIAFALGHSLVIDNMRIMEYLPVTGDHVVNFDLGQYILEANMGVINPDHLNLLVDHCKPFGFHATPSIAEVRKMPTPQWAFLDEEMATVAFSCAHATNRFYLRIEKFDKLLNDVEEECQNMAKSLQGKLFRVRKGDICIVESNGEYSRARVEEMYENGEVMCYCVDRGDCVVTPVSACKPISRKLITKLPFQAIECTLGGVEHTQPESEDILNALQYDFSEDGTKPFFVLYKKTEQKPRFTRGHLYAVNILHPVSGLSFNRQIVDLGLTSASLDDADMLSNVDIAPPLMEEFRFDILEKLIKRDCLEDYNEFINNYSSDQLAEDAKLVDTENTTQEPTVEENAQDNRNEGSAAENSVNCEASGGDAESDVTESSAGQDGVGLVPIPLFMEKHLNPQGYWSQDARTLRIRFQILQVDNDSLQLFANCKNFILRCFSVNSTLYEVCFTLFGPVEHEFTKIHVTPFQVSLSFPKLLKGKDPWPRLLESPGKCHMLAPDPDYATEEYVMDEGDDKMENRTADDTTRPDGADDKPVYDGSYDPDAL